MEVLATGIPAPGDPDRKRLDLRIRLSRCSLQKEIILQKDSRLPEWRRACTDYSLLDTYFYRAADKIYTVCFLVLTMSGEQPYQRIMCVTGDVTDLWQAALSYQPDFSKSGY